MGSDPSVRGNLPPGGRIRRFVTALAKQMAHQVLADCLGKLWWNGVPYLLILRAGIATEKHAFGESLNCGAFKQPETPHLVGMNQASAGMVWHSQNRRGWFVPC
jgi:hypothetical protein